MRYLPPRRWHEVTPGTVIVDHHGMARRVIDIRPTPVDDLRLVFIEGLPPHNVIGDRLIAVVELDESDVVVNLLRAGFTVQPVIKGA